MSWRRLRAKAKLTPKEWEVLEFIVLGYTVPQMAKLANRSTRTINTHKENIRGKLGIGPHEDWRIVQWAIEHDLIEIHF
jgi:DNA-binding NarL/FixJ family response regulator